MISRIGRGVAFLITAVVVLASTGRPVCAQTQPKPSLDVQHLFTPSGWMGDGEYGRKYIVFAAADRTQPHAEPTSIKITYAFGPRRWGGMYWQNLPDNWGDKPGFDYSRKGFSKITFWAKGETGTEAVEFKAGGIDRSEKSYRDSLVATTGSITLTKDWKQYAIDLSGENLSSVIGAFCWVANSDSNSGNAITFYLEDIKME